MTFDSIQQLLPAPFPEELLFHGQVDVEQYRLLAINRFAAVDVR
jgi:hypothetical protein